VPVPALKNLFEKNEKPVWIVRGLTGIELAEVREAAQRNLNLEGLIELAASNLPKEKIKAVKEIIGLPGESKSEGSPDDYVRRLAILRLGSVEPEIEQPLAVKLAANYPVIFSKLTDEIMVLTGQGRLGEFKASGTTPK
jgi:hypothetical protein